MKAKSNPKIGYMNKMKKLWDEIHPELTFFSAKKLGDQASTVEKKELSWKQNTKLIKIKTTVTLLIMTVPKKIPILNLNS